MANLNFKANLLPNSNEGYSLGSSDKKWNIYGGLTGTASNALEAQYTSHSLTIGESIFNGSEDVAVSIKDLGLTTSMTFIGVVTTNITEGSITNPVTLKSGSTITAVQGAVALKESDGTEYIFSEGTWQELGLATSYALANHIHGNISSIGAITSSTAIANGDALIIADNSSSNKLIKTTITFDGSTTSKVLSQKGTWVDNNLANTVTGTGTSGYLVKFNGTNTITNGPELGSGTTFLKNDGTWATPTNTKNTAGSTDSKSTMYLIGATSQTASIQTYSNSNIQMTENSVRIARDGETYFRLQNTSTTAAHIGLIDINTSGQFGAYDSTHGRWIWYNTLSNSAYFSGRASCAVYAATAGYATSAGTTTTATNYLPLSGGTLTGNLILQKTSTIANNYPATIQFKTIQSDNSITTTNAHIYVYDDHDTAANGTNMVIQSAGNMIIGGGESPDNCYNTDLKNSTGENLYLTSDNGIYFYTNCGTYANKRSVNLNANISFNRAAPNSCSYYNGRDWAFLRQTSYNSWCPMISAKSTSGSWELGTYASNALRFCYTPDSSYSGATNTGTVTGIYLASSGVLYGACWNDYAEYRKDNLKEKDIQEPGRCVYELGDGSLALTTERLQRGCEIISDTFGFAIGQDEENGYNTPIASNGRVLAYPYESIEEFKSHIGYAVCSGPNGTVSIMTNEEEEKYSLRAIGTISEIPDYEEWGTGKVKVNGRVWIRIR